jgi:hypothetical protein
MVLDAGVYDLFVCTGIATCSAQPLQVTVPKTVAGL